MIQLLRKLRLLYLLYFKWRRYSFGSNPYIGRSVYLWAKHTITVGKNFYIGKFSQIECDAKIGNDVMFGNFVALIGRYDHDYSQVGTPIRIADRIRDENYNWKGLSEMVIIEDDVWVGHGSIILSGVKIEKGSIIAAGSVVTKNVESCSIYAGNPARKIKNRFETEVEKAEHFRLLAKRYETASFGKFTSKASEISPSL